MFIITINYTTSNKISLHHEVDLKRYISNANTSQRKNI